MSERLDEVEPVIIPYEDTRRIWFETGGYDIWGDATDEELAIAEDAREDQVNESQE